MIVTRRSVLALAAIGAGLTSGCADDAETERLNLFDSVWRCVADNYYDTAQLGAGWQHTRQLWRPRAAKVASRAELYLAVLIPMLERLNASHIRLTPSSTLRLPPHTSVPIPRMRRGDRPFYLNSADETGMGAQLTWSGDRLIASDVEPKGPAAASGLQTGDPVLETAYRASDTGGRLTLINHRNNREIVVDWERSPPAPTRVYQQIADQSACIRFDAFDKESIDWLFDKLALPHEVLVLDLRNNRGGLISQCRRALSGFLPPQMDLGAFRDRTKQMPLRTSSAPRLVAPRLVIVTSARTMSGGEIFAHNLRLHRNATLVGERTAGAVLASQFYGLSDDGKLLLPYADYRTSSGERLEGIGVVPDVIETRMDGASLLVAAQNLASAA